jgi:hypothetical protein
LFAYEHINDARAAKARTHRNDPAWLSLNFANYADATPSHAPRPAASASAISIKLMAIDSSCI